MIPVRFAWLSMVWDVPAVALPFADQSELTAHTHEFAAVVVTFAVGRPDVEDVPVIAPAVGAPPLSVNTLTTRMVPVAVPTVVVTVLAADEAVAAVHTSAPDAVPVPPVEDELGDFRPRKVHVRPPESVTVWSLAVVVFGVSYMTNATRNADAGAVKDAVVRVVPPAARWETSAGEDASTARVIGASPY
jgi:hypothetical protein